MLKLFRDVILLILFAAAFFVAIQATLQTSVIEGDSMEPNLHDGQRILLNKAVFYYSDPGRGEIIVFHHPRDPHGIPPIKRVIGLPGELVEIRDGKVYINGLEIDEPYITDPPQYDMGEITVPAEHYFVLGDNRNHSEDSHFEWTVSRENIIAKAWLSIWPPDLWGPAPHYRTAAP